MSPESWRRWFKKNLIFFPSVAENGQQHHKNCHSVHGSWWALTPCSTSLIAKKKCPCMASSDGASHLWLQTRTFRREFPTRHCMHLTKYNNSWDLGLPLPQEIRPGLSEVTSFLWNRLKWSHRAVDCILIVTLQLCQWAHFPLAYWYCRTQDT